MTSITSAIVLRHLHAAGWTPGREAAPAPEIQALLHARPAMARHPAVAALRQLAGLTLGKVGAGQECASSDIAFHWSSNGLADAHTDAELLLWQDVLKTCLVQVAEVHHGHGLLLMAADGRCFGMSLVHDAFCFEGENLEQAMAHLLGGVHSRPMLRPGQQEVHLYGKRYTRHSPETYAG
ncbi:SUKH-3 domain-containing protein [Comamonas sp. w2-DMI]|uniref:SUKH-3 domain-containing protein n=1 Tax=Comamonas sp. w2-DMI TaxID=3126391 RepID=UPI0032E437A0